MCADNKAWWLHTQADARVFRSSKTTELRKRVKIKTSNTDVMIKASVGIVKLPSICIQFRSSTPEMVPWLRFYFHNLSVTIYRMLIIHSSLLSSIRVHRVYCFCYFLILWWYCWNKLGECKHVLSLIATQTFFPTCFVPFFMHNFIVL